MDRASALGDFREKIAGTIQTAKEEIEGGFIDGAEELYGRILEGLDRLCRKTAKRQESEALPPIRYFQISLLRSYMPLGQLCFLASAYGSGYFLDRKSTGVLIRADNLTGAMARLREDLRQAVKEYRGAILYSDADRALMETAYSVNRRLADEARRYLWDFDMRAQVKAVQKDNPFFIKWGGHWEESATVFAGDARKRSQELFESLNQLNDIEKMDAAYAYGNWDEVLFDGLKAEGKALLYQSFRRAAFEQCQVAGCTLYGSSLRNAHMKKTVFSGCNLSGCNFKETVLEDVLFSGCDLTHADFRGSQLDGVSFTRSIMEGAEFSRESVPSLQLEPGQFQQIKIQGEGRDVFFNQRG